MIHNKETTTIIMSKQLAEDQTTKTSSTMATQVLNIGQAEPETAEASKQKKLNFNDKFQKRLADLLLPGTQPLPCDMNLLESFGVKSYRRNGKQYYRFDFDDDRTDLIYSAVAFDAQHVLHLVKKRLKDEKWVSKNEIELPLKTKKDIRYIQIVVSECIEEDNRRPFYYVHQLSKQNRNSQ